jgi:hypothetical protein
MLGIRKAQRVINGWVYVDFSSRCPREIFCISRSSVRVVVIFFYPSVLFNKTLVKRGSSCNSERQRAGRLEVNCGQWTGRLEVNCGQRTGRLEVNCGQRTGRLEVNCGQRAGRLEVNCGQRTGRLEVNCGQRTGRLEVNCGQR